MQNEHPLVSVVIPTYNRPNLIIRAVESVNNQTYSNIEIIVVDDASEQDIESVLAKFDKVKFIKNNKNQGPCFSRNEGLREAKGEFINFLDDDDFIYPNKIKKQIDLFLKSIDSNLGMVTSHAVDGRSGSKFVKYNCVKGNIYDELLNSYVVSGIETMLFKTDGVKEIGGFDERLESSQEYDLLIRFTEKYTVDYVDEVLSQENRSVNQISTNFDKKINGARYLYRKHDQRFKDKSWLYWLKMQLKLKLLLIRFYIGKLFGEKTYRLFLRK